jgi:hypothetical protein
MRLTHPLKRSRAQVSAPVAAAAAGSKCACVSTAAKHGLTLHDLKVSELLGTSTQSIALNAQHAQGSTDTSLQVANHSLLMQSCSC